MTSNDLLNIIFGIFIAGCIYFFVIGIAYTLTVYLPAKRRMAKIKEANEKQRRIIEGDNLLNEYEIGLEWGRSDN